MISNRDWHLVPKTIMRKDLCSLLSIGTCFEHEQERNARAQFLCRHARAGKKDMNDLKDDKDRDWTYL